MIVTGDRDAAGDGYVTRIVDDCVGHGIPVCNSRFGDEGDLTDLLDDDHQAAAERLLEVLDASCVRVGDKAAV